MVLVINIHIFCGKSISGETEKQLVLEQGHPFQC